MPPPKKTTWKLDDHTQAKHVILRHYLEAWFPILGSWSGRIVYYDGFAGPGKYEGGEIGSPLIALRVAQDHRAGFSSEIVFVFVENEEKRAEHLRREIEKERLKSNFTWSVVEKPFADALGRTLDDLERRGLQMAPTFALVDPFGITGLPFQLIARLLSQQRSEVLVTFMNHAVQRWATELPEQVDELIGVSGASAEIAAAPDRIAKARELYKRSLRTVARFVRFFEMRGARNRPIYDLFFASNHEKGHYKMKEAMWKADRAGDFRFSDGIDPTQVTLFSPDSEAARGFAPRLWEHFRGQTVVWEEVQRHTRNSTPFLDKHARGALRLMEAKGGLDGRTIDVAKKKADGTPRKKSTYPAGTRTTFSK